MKLAKMVMEAHFGLKNTKLTKGLRGVGGSNLND